MVIFSMTYLKIMEVVRNPVPFIFLIFIPIGLTLLVGLFLDEGLNELEIPIALVDEDRTELSITIAKRMKDQAKIHIHEVSSEQANRMLLRNDVDSVFVIKKGFQEKLLHEQRENTIEIWVTPSSMAVGIVKEVMASEVVRLTSNIKASEQVVKLYKVLDIQTNQLDSLWNEAYLYTDRQWEPEPLMTIQYDKTYVEAFSAETMDVTYSPYLGLWTFFTMLSCFLTSDWIVREKTTLFSRIQSTYKGLISYVMHSSGVFFLFHAIQAILCFSVFVKLNIVQPRLEVVLMMILYVFISIATSVFIASCTKYIGSYYIMSVLFVILLGILGGSFFPVQEFYKSLTGFRIIFPQDVLLNREQTEMKFHVVFSVCVSIFLWTIAVRRLRIKL